MRIVLATSLLVGALATKSSPDTTLNKLRSSSGPTITRYVRHALDSECYIEMLEAAMPTLSALLAKQWGDQSTYKDAMQATLDLVLETLPADLITSLWSEVDPTFYERDAKEFLEKVRNLESGLEVKMRFAVAILLKMPGAFNKQIGENDKSQVSYCLKLANAMSKGSKKGAKKNFSLCAGQMVDEDTMRALDVIFINFGHLINIDELVKDDHWLLSDTAHDRAMLTGARFIIHLHQQRNTEKWSSFQTWLQEGGADPQELIGTLPLSTIVMIMFDTRLQQHGARIVEFADWLWANNAAATQYLRTLADRDPKPIFNVLDENGYEMFPRSSLSIGQAQDGTESVVCGLLMLHCFLLPDDINGKCETIRNLSVHPMVAVRRAMAAHQYKIADEKWSRKHFKLLPFIDFNQYQGKSLEIIPNKLPTGAVMVQNAARLCNVLNCEGRKVRMRTSEYPNLQQHGQQYGGDRTRVIRGQAPDGDYVDLPYGEQPNEGEEGNFSYGERPQYASTMRNHPRPSAPPMGSWEEDEMRAFEDEEYDPEYAEQPMQYGGPFMGYAAHPVGYSMQHPEHDSSQIGSFAHHPGRYNQPAGGSIQYSGQFNQPTGHFVHHPGQFNQPPGYSNQPPGYSNQPAGLSNEPSEYFTPHSGQPMPVGSAYQADPRAVHSVSQVPPGLENCTDQYNRCIAGSVYSLLKTRLNEEEVEGLMSHMSDWSTDELMEYYGATRKSFETTGETTPGLLDWLGSKTLNRFSVDWTYSPNMDSEGKLSGAWDWAKQKTGGFMGGLAGMFSHGPSPMYGSQPMSEYASFPQFQPGPPGSPGPEDHVSSLADWASNKEGKAFAMKPPKQFETREGLLQQLHETLSEYLSPDEVQQTMNVAQSQRNEDLEEFLQKTYSVNPQSTNMRGWILGDFKNRFGPIRGVVDWASDAAGGFYNRVGSFFSGASDYFSRGAGSLNKFLDFVGDFGIDVNLEWLNGHGPNLLSCLQNLFPNGTERPDPNDRRAKYLIKFMMAFPHLSLPEFFYPNLSLSELLRKMVGMGLEGYGELWSQLMGMLSEEEIAKAMDTSGSGNLSDLVATATKAKLLDLIHQGRQEEIHKMLELLAGIYDVGPGRIPVNVRLTSEEKNLSNGMNLEQLFDMILMDAKNVTVAVDRIGRVELVEMLFHNQSREALDALDRALYQKPEDYNRLIRIAISQAMEINGHALRSYIKDRIHEDLDSKEVSDIITHEFYGRYFMDYLLDNYVEHGKA